MSISFPAPQPLTEEQQTNKALVVQAFEACKKRLWSGSGRQGTNFEAPICYALAASRHPGYILAEQVIVARLKPYGVVMVTKYLEKNGYAGQDNIVIQACRLAWVNKIIEELST